MKIFCLLNIRNCIFNFFNFLIFLKIVKIFLKVHIFDYCIKQGFEQILTICHNSKFLNIFNSKIKKDHRSLISKNCLKKLHNAKFFIIYTKYFSE